MTYKSYIGELDFDGRPHGQGRHKYSDGSSYTGDYKAGVPHGYGEMLYVSGASFHGFYTKGLKHGQGTYTYDNGKKYIGTWRDGQRHGPGRYVYADGAVVRHDYYLGERIGDLGVQTGDGTPPDPESGGSTGGGNRGPRRDKAQLCTKGVTATLAN